nr:NUDIX hydrolase [Plantactinospora mayteni]
MGQNVPMTISADDSGPVRIVTAVLRDGDRVLLCHRSAGRRWYPDVWDLPGGHVEEGEEPKESLVRELREELGITASEPSSPPMHEIRTATFDMQIWLVDRWTGTPVNAAPDEHDAVVPLIALLRSVLRRRVVVRMTAAWAECGRRSPSSTRVMTSSASARQPGRSWAAPMPCSAIITAPASTSSRTVPSRTAAATRSVTACSSARLPSARAPERSAMSVASVRARPSWASMWSTMPRSKVAKASAAAAPSP